MITAALLPEGEELPGDRRVGTTEGVAVDATTGAVDRDISKEEVLGQFGAGGKHRALAVDDGGRPMGHALALPASDVSGNDGDAILDRSSDQDVRTPGPQSSFLGRSVTTMHGHGEQLGS